MSSTTAATSSSNPTTSPRVAITEERQRVEAGNQVLHLPSFVDSKVLWKDAMLPKIATYLFIINSLPDVNFMQLLFACPQLPSLITVITSISLPNFHWFSGIRDNIKSNPYLDFAKSLPNLEILSLGFHSAGMASSFHKERERIAMEHVEKVEESKKKKVMGVEEVVAFYKLEDLFALKKIRKISLTLLDSELEAHFVKKGDVGELMGELREWVVEGFRKGGREVEVEVERTAVAYT